MQVTVNFHNANPSTIWGRLADRLGRDPTNAEANADVRRILDEATCERTEQGLMRHQVERV